MDQVPDPESAGEEIIDPLPPARLLLVSYATLLVVSGALAFFATGTLRKGTSAAEFGRHLVLGVLAGIALVALSALLSRTIRAFRELEAELQQLFRNLDLRSLLLLALLSGTAEEILFRGVLQPAVGYIAASLLFGAAHLAPSMGMLPWPLFAAAAGFLFGWLFDYTGGLAAPTAAHVLVNALSLLRIQRLDSGPVRCPDA